VTRKRYRSLLGMEKGMAKKHSRPPLNRLSAKDTRSLFIVIGIILLVFLIALVPVLRYILAIIVFGVVLFFVVKYERRRQKIEKGDVYQIQHHCPNCDRLNVFKYPMGSPAKGTTVQCHYCRRKYTV